MDPQAAVASARSGDFRPLLAARKRGKMSSLPAGWAALFDVMAHLAGLDVDAPSVEDICRAAEDPSGREGASRALGELFKLAFLRFDQGLLSRVRDVAANRATASEGSIALSLGDTLHLLALGQADGALEVVSDAFDRARAARSPHLVVESTALRALCLLEAGEVADALSIARRASRMARAEQQPQPEYLANIVLARARRRAGQPHLATRILTALVRAAPGPFHSWLGFELCLSNGPPSAPIVADVGDPAAMLHRLLGAALAGNRAAYDAAVAEARVRVSGMALFAADLERVAFLVDAARPIEKGPKEAQRWAGGHSDEVPFGLTGLDGLAEESQHAAAAAWIHAPISGTARRIVGAGVPLAEAQGAVLAEKQHRKQGRVETALAILAMRGEMPVSMLFRAVYGFSYVHGIHRGQANTLLNRMRGHLPPGATIERAGEVLRLCAEVALLVPDPRCARTLEDRMLALVARNPGATARDAAKALGVSLRSAQAALETLVDEGACLRDRDHRQVGYRVEDTTFQEPTMR